jgi:hypothetical protein
MKKKTKKPSPKAVNRTARKSASTAKTSRPKKRRCGECGELGHNARSHFSPRGFLQTANRR